MQPMQPMNRCNRCNDLTDATALSSALRRCPCRARRRTDLPYPHLAQRVAHRKHRLPHFIGADRADAADTKGLDLCQLAGIKDEALVANALVKMLEGVLRIGRRVKRNDNRRLNLG